MVEIDSNLHNAILLGPTGALDHGPSKRPAEPNPTSEGEVEGSALETHHRAYICLLEHIEPKDEIIHTVHYDHCQLKEDVRRPRIQGPAAHASGGNRLSYHVEEQQNPQLRRLAKDRLALPQDNGCQGDGDLHRRRRPSSPRCDDEFQRSPPARVASTYSCCYPDSELGETTSHETIVDRQINRRLKERLHSLAVGLDLVEEHRDLGPHKIGRISARGRQGTTAMFESENSY